MHIEDFIESGVSVETVEVENVKELQISSSEGMISNLFEDKGN